MSQPQETFEPASAKQLADGVYFDLPDAIYRAQKRLSASLIKKMLVSPATFWASSWLNPKREEADTDTLAKRVGRAYHCARLEPDELEARYVPEIDWSAYGDDLLTSGRDIEARLAELGETKKKSGENVDDQARRLGVLDPDAKIKHLLLEEWESERDGREPIPHAIWEDIEEAGKLLRRNREADTLLSDGAAEVTILWTDAAGRKWKARLDYLTAVAVSDLKTFDNTMDKAIERFLPDRVRYGRLHVQAYIYWEAVDRMRRGELKVHAHDEDDMALAARVMARPTPLGFHFVFEEKGAVPNILCREIPMLVMSDDDQTSPEEAARLAIEHEHYTGLARRARHDLNAATRLFDTYRTIYADGEPWVPYREGVSLTDDDFNPHWLEANYE